MIVSSTEPDGQHEQHRSRDSPTQGRGASAARENRDIGLARTPRATLRSSRV